MRRRTLVPVGVLLAAVCMPLMGVAPSYGLLLVAVAPGRHRGGGVSTRSHS